MFVSAFLFSLSMCLDNIIVGITCGINKITISLYINIIIALITTMGTFISMLIGTYIRTFIPIPLTKLLGPIIFIILGIILFIRNLLETPKNENINKSIIRKKDMNFKEGILVALGLSLNNLATGVIASIAGLNLIITLIITFIISIFMLIISINFSSYLLNKFSEKNSALLGSLLLISLGFINILFN